MSSWKVTLFRKFNVECDGKKIFGIEARKVQELLSYLLIFRNHPQSRELLSETLWNNNSSEHSKKYLRQTLWRLQSALRLGGNVSEPVLLLDQDWIQFNLTNDFWLDIAEFENTFDFLNGKKTAELSTLDYDLLKHAVGIYKGDLLEGWYQDWCIFERERYQTMQLTLLDMLVQYCEIHKDYEAGLKYAWQILRFDRAYERAHRQMMRLYFLSGNRTQALYQYDRCVEALQSELGVEPSERTKRLYEQIRSDAFTPLGLAVQKAISGLDEADPALNNVLGQIEQFAVTLKNIEAQIHQELVALEKVLSDRG